MAISHADHDHPNTPAARAACRKAMAKITVTVDSGKIRSTGMTMTVVPRKRGDGGVVKGLVKAMKTSAGKMIKTPADIPVDCPRPLHYAITTAWSRGWEVVEGYKLNDDENRMLIGGTVAQVSVVWNPSDGRCAVFVRRLTSSVTHRADSAQAALWLASGEDEWPWEN